MRAYGLLCAVVEERGVDVADADDHLAAGRGQRFLVRGIKGIAVGIDQEAAKEGIKLGCVDLLDQGIDYGLQFGRQLGEFDNGLAIGYLGCVTGAAETEIDRGATTGGRQRDAGSRSVAWELLPLVRCLMASEYARGGRAWLLSRVGLV